MQVYQVTWRRRLLSSNRPMVLEWLGWWDAGKGRVACVICGHIYVWCVVCVSKCLECREGLLEAVMRQDDALAGKKHHAARFVHSKRTSLITKISLSDW
jgi:hypothetical protein